MRYNQTGQILVITLIFTLVILVLTGALLSFVLQNVQATRRALATEQALQLADGGIDKAIWQLNQSAGTYSGETGTVLGTGTIDVAVSSVSGNLKEITSTGYSPNKANPVSVKQVKVMVSITSGIVSFNYGIQVGDGGLRMGDGSQVIGNVYSNGTILGKKDSVVTGDAYSARSTGEIKDMKIQGNAYAHDISKSTVNGISRGYSLVDTIVGGDAYAYSISNCTITGEAYYTTRSSCTVSGGMSTPFAGYPDPLPEDFSISDSQITAWKNSAASGGIIIGDLTISGSVSLGPKKITGKLKVNRSGRLILTGPVWVEKNIDIDTDGLLILDPSYGDFSEVIIADQDIDLSKEVEVQRAGPNSYVLMISTTTGDDAIKLAKGANALVAYAKDGEVHVQKHTEIREITGWKVRLDKDVSVIYESGLTNVSFSGGPGGSWSILRGTWREVQ